MNLRLDNKSIAGIKNPTNGDNVTSWTGTTVYYGNKAYYVLDRNGGLGGNSSMAGHMLLFSKGVLEASGTFDNTDPVTSDWSKSDIRTDLNESGFYSKNGVFTDLEKGAISITPISNDNTSDYFDYYSGNRPYSYPSGSDDHIFLLDLKDVRNPNYGFCSGTTGHDKKADPNCTHFWWLRSPGSDNNGTASVNQDGTIQPSTSTNSDDGSVRPAFNLDLSKVLFSIVPGAGYDHFSSIAVTDSNLWKLVLQGNNTTLNPTKTSGNTSLQPGYSEETLEIGHTAANTVLTGDIAATQVSAMLTDSNGTVLYYGKINDNTATNSNVIIPAGLTEGNYKLYVFAEDVKGDTETNYASALGTPIAITVGNPPTPQTPPSSDDRNSDSDSDSSSTTTEEAYVNPLVWCYEANPLGSMCLIEHQGPVCVKAFNDTTPKGYKEAFSFNILLRENDIFKPSHVKKSGKFVLNIPKEWQKPGRTFILIGIDKFGNTKTFSDTDLSDETFTTLLDVEGYAFSLIYTDN